MNTQIALMLAQDGVVTGAVYALMALALVLTALWMLGSAMQAGPQEATAVTQRAAPAR